MALSQVKLLATADVAAIRPLGFYQRTYQIFQTLKVQLLSNYRIVWNVHYMVQQAADSGVTLQGPGFAPSLSVPQKSTTSDLASYIQTHHTTILRLL